MKTLKKNIALGDIAKLINLLDQKFDEKFKYTNSKIIGIYGEIDGMKQQLEGFREETQNNFKGVYDGLSSSLERNRLFA